MSGHIDLSADEVIYLIRLHVGRLDNVERIKGITVNERGEATVLVDFKNPVTYAH